MPTRILKYILLFLSLAVAFPVMAQQDSVTTAKPGRIRGVQYSSREEAALAMRNVKQPLFAGFSVSGNFAGLLLAAATSYGELECALRVNLRNTYFPIGELGIGVCDNTDDGTELHYKTRAPFIRLGCDYNFLRDKQSGNRVFAGARVGFTSFKYDVDGPDFEDLVWGDRVPYKFKGVKGNQTWIELVFGIEAKIWSIFHLGWSARYKNRITHSSGSPGEPWYVPGYGKKGGSALGGTFNLIFDI